MSVVTGTFQTAEVSSSMTNQLRNRHKSAPTFSCTRYKQLRQDAAQCNGAASSGPLWVEALWC